MGTGFNTVQAQSDDPFITVWKTDNEGESDDNEITIPGQGIDYPIQWVQVQRDRLQIWREVDGGHSGSETGSGTHTIEFPEAGFYMVSIGDGFRRINFSHESDRLKIVDVTQWGDIEWTTMNSAFPGAENLSITATDAPDLSQVTDMTRMFRNAESFNGDIGHWDTGNVETMNRMFKRADSFNQDIGGWYTAEITSMFEVFMGAESFNGDISNWDTRNVTHMNEMFKGAETFDQDFGFWNTGQVETMSGMFSEAVSFDQDIGNLDVRDVQDMENMLDGSGLSVDNYDNTLAGWAQQQVQPDVILGAEGLYYCHSAEERQHLVDEFDWTINDAGISVYCEKPGPVVLVDPGDEDPIEPDAVTFTWNVPQAGVEQYGFELAGDESFDALVIDSVTTDTTITLNDLESESIYYWRVRGENDTGRGGLSGADADGRL
ncbi:BspA family leucine-rich repeat surface protein [Natronogracilivirga saccharolytica]|uniref:BspA family leucine-rich repeat surface protein n=1 Tax=Natronogracilivirga saccharolytica TaxID=2812953 RepID=A0A8J7UTY0_9BACT|nr:BspA family leucine-rich repeat surface protein [Natronogracilivirga saccharolytica]MBP3191825.1 BspA family leucine-rich repeat surface protein [Natronogracilivirga saccharolytica]